MKQKMDYLTFVIASIRNKPGRNLATVFCFAFIAATIFSGQFLMAGTTGSVNAGVSRMGADLIVTPPAYTLWYFRDTGRENSVLITRVEPTEARVNTDKTGHIMSVPGVLKTSPQLYVSTVNITEVSSSPVDLYGIDPVTDFTIQPWLRRPLESPPGPGEVIIGSTINADISSEIQVSGHIYTVKGKLDPTGSGVDQTIFLGMNDAYALAATPGVLPASAQVISQGDVNAVLVKVEPGADPAMVAARIKQPTQYLDVAGKHFTLNTVSEDIQGLPRLLGMLSMVVILAAFPLISLIGAMVANERQREIGLFRSMGARSRVIFTLVLTESFTLSVIGGLIGVAGSLLVIFMLDVTGVLGTAFQGSFQMPPVGETAAVAALALAIIIILGSISALWPAWRSSTMNPYDAIRRDG